MNTVIEFKQVSKKYNKEITAIENLTFAIDKGELVFLAGPSGAGKTTILKLISGITTSTSGNVIVHNINLNKINYNKRTLIRHHIGIIFQDHKILMDRSVFKNVCLPLEILGYAKKETDHRVAIALEKVGLEHKIHAHPIELSGGEQQRLCIARAIIHKPKIIIADEPTANLDKDNALKIIELLKSFHKAGTTIIISAHDEGILTDYGKRIIRINNGTFSK